MKKTVLITGCSTGVGFESALLFAANGYTVFATMRDLNKQNLLLEKARSMVLELNILALDVCDQGSIDACVQNILEKEGRIDILINNAGAGLAKTTEQCTEAEMQWVMDVNFFGTMRCTKAVLPQMRAQKSGRIINISSVGGLVGQPFNELYCAAKFAVEGYTESLASYLTEAFGIHFSLVEPGGITTEFSKSAMQKSMTDGQMTIPPYQPILDQYLAKRAQRASDSTEKVFQSPEEVAAVIWDLAQLENPPLRTRTSEWSEMFTKLKTAADPDGLGLLAEVKSRFL